MCKRTKNEGEKSLGGFVWEMWLKKVVDCM